MDRIMGDDGRQHFVARGDGPTRKVAVFLHGGGGSAAAFARDFAAFQPRSGEVWVFGDARTVDDGQQRWVPYGVPSPWRTAPTTDEPYVRGLVEAYGPAYLIAYSSGGRLALSLAGMPGILGIRTVGATCPIDRLAAVDAYLGPIHAIMGLTDPHRDGPPPLATWAATQAAIEDRSEIRRAVSRHGGHDWSAYDSDRAIAWLRRQP